METTTMLGLYWYNNVKDTSNNRIHNHSTCNNRCGFGSNPVKSFAVTNIGACTSTGHLWPKFTLNGVA